ncbi:MAG: phosphopantetheine-binding protein [Microlunatus sp.]
MTIESTKLDEVKAVLVSSLGIEDRADSINAATTLFGGIPELDSLAVLELVTAIEEKFDITIEDDEFGGEIFETLGSLTEFVTHKV